VDSAFEFSFDMAKHIPGAKERVRIFIVEDHPIYRDGLVHLMTRRSDWSVCGQAGNAHAALTAIEKQKPDVVLVDLSLPGRNGLELIKDIHALRPQTRVLAISMHDELLYAQRVLRAGGRGYIMKQEGPEVILEAIQKVRNGEIVLSTQMATRLLHAFSDPRGSNVDAMSRLSDRQLEILRLIGEGYDNPVIAKKLHLSPKTVDAHRVQIRTRLQLKNLTEVISFAARWVESQKNLDGAKASRKAAREPRIRRPIAG
jgi:DNA-binding NarL/FixJ family response regulator